LLLRIPNIPTPRSSPFASNPAQGTKRLFPNRHRLFKAWFVEDSAESKT